MAESVEDFLARGGKVESVAPDVRKFENDKAHHRYKAKKKANADYTDWSMRRAENQEDIPNGN